MTAAEIVAGLRSAGVRLWLDNGQLRYKGPASALTASARSTLSAIKPAILALLEAEASSATDADFSEFSEFSEPQKRGLAVGDLVDAADPVLERLGNEWPAVADDTYTPAGGGGDWVGLRTKGGEWIAWVAIEHVRRAAAVAPAQRQLVGVG